MSSLSVFSRNGWFLGCPYGFSSLFSSKPAGGTESISRMVSNLLSPSSAMAGMAASGRDESASSALRNAASKRLRMSSS